MTARIDASLTVGRIECARCEAACVVYPSLRRPDATIVHCPSCSPTWLGSFALSRLLAERAEHGLGEMQLPEGVSWSKGPTEEASA